MEEETEMDIPQSQMSVEEETGDEIDMMLQQLAGEVDGEKIGNKVMVEDHTIEYYSETESFAIDGTVDFMVGNKKMKLKTVEDVVTQLQTMMEMEPALESRRWRKSLNRRR